MTTPEILSMTTTRFTLGILWLSIPFAAMAGQASTPSPANKSPPREPATLVEKVRRGVPEAFRNPFTAMSVGWRNVTACVSGENQGAMGIHLVFNPSPVAGQPPPKLADGILDPLDPEALIYEPAGNGLFRLVGVEFIELAEHWAGMVKNDSTLPATPRVDGHLMTYVGAPNRFGLPAFYELHVWAFEDNPVGTFADWNTLVKCDRAKPDDLPDSDVGP
jgi:hypothetical protein